jgi:secondary thiamine-phosphate synthase enzyme
MIKKIEITTHARVELKDVTGLVRQAVRGSNVRDGVCTVYVPHTTAAVTINEHADPDVVRDIIDGLARMVPDEADYRHAEGNSPAHIKAALLGASASIFVENGDLVLGTWQGIFFCEFDGPRSRKLYVRVTEG